MKKLTLLVFTAMLSVFSSCEKEEIVSASDSGAQTAIPVLNTAKALLVENMELGTKTSYTTGNVTLTTGSWSFNDALLGTTASDRKTGSKSARVRNSGKLTMNFNKTTGIGDVTVWHAKYGTDANSTWQLYYSTNNGVSWTAVGVPVTTSSTTLVSTLVKVNVAGTVRIEIRKTDGSTNRINFDNVSIDDFSGIEVNNPVPVITTMSPSLAVAGSSSITLQVNGSNFVTGSVIRWNGFDLTTALINSSIVSASINSALLATVGTAQVTVFNPLPGGGISNSATFIIQSAPVNPIKKFLFDNRHAQTAGNADWVIDQNSNVAGRYPTPAQSNVTQNTSETFWTGGISAWGIALAKLGHTVETLPTSGSITYGNSNNSQDLTNYHVFIVDEPNTVFTSSEKTAILNFVQNGGSLMMIANHDGSDRNNDGWDAPRIWNDLMANNSVQNNPFGFTVNLANIVQSTANISSSASPVLYGSQGNVSSIEFNNGTTLSINTAVNPNAQGLIWTSGASQNSTNILCATSTFGTGRVFFLGDSSPTDDGTGATGNVLYNGWGVFSHSKLLMNASLWCAKLQ